MDGFNRRRGQMVTNGRSTAIRPRTGNHLRHEMKALAVFLALAFASVANADAWPLKYTHPDLNGTFAVDPSTLVEAPASATSAGVPVRTVLVRTTTRSFGIQRHKIYRMMVYDCGQGGGRYLRMDGDSFDIDDLSEIWFWSDDGGLGLWPDIARVVCSLSIDQG